MLIKFILENFFVNLKYFTKIIELKSENNENPINYSLTPNIAYSTPTPETIPILRTA